MNEAAAAVFDETKAKANLHAARLGGCPSVYISYELGDDWHIIGFCEAYRGGQGRAFVALPRWLA